MNFFQKLVSGIRGAVEAFTKPFRESKEPEPTIEEPTEDPRVTKFKDENRNTIREANLRYDELVRNDLGAYSQAWTDAQLTGGRFDIEDIDNMDELIREVLRAEAFINNPSSNIDEASYRKRVEIGEEIASDARYFGYDLYNPQKSADSELIGNFWYAVDRVREEDDIGGRLKAINYSADAAYGYAFNVWVESGYDQKALKESLEDFLQEQERIHTREVSAQMGKATFEYGKDDW